jgi:nucleotide-binding universal stress UspA family protein
VSEQQQVVVVGVDGSGSDAAALVWAADTAVRYAVPLRIVHAVEALSMGSVAVEMATPTPEMSEALTTVGVSSDVADRAAEQVRRRHADLPVEVTESLGAASALLLAQQDEAMLLVVGRGRKGAVDRFLMGTTSMATVMHARCPVAVIDPEVRNDAEPKGVVLVAVDGGRDSERACQTAFLAADRRGAKVVAVNVWYIEVVNGYVVTEADSPEWRSIEDRQRRRVEALVASAREAYPDVPVEIEVLHGPSSRTIVERSADADVLVMGTRGRGGFVGKLLGSTTHKVLEAARCPVVVVRISGD